MNKIIIGFTLLASMSSFASELNLQYNFSKAVGSNTMTTAKNEYEVNLHCDSIIRNGVSQAFLTFNTERSFHSKGFGIDTKKCKMLLKAMESISSSQIISFKFDKSTMTLKEVIVNKY